MVRRLYERFLKDRDEYQAAQEYWEELVARVAASLGQQAEWSRWIPRESPNGTPVELDGNPICDGSSQRLDRAFRIIQHAASGDEVEIAAWLKSYEEEYVDLPRDELVINLSLSEESARLAETLLRMWMTPDVKLADVRRFISDELPPMENGPTD